MSNPQTTFVRSGCLLQVEPRRRGFARQAGGPTSLSRAALTRLVSALSFALNLNWKPKQIRGASENETEEVALRSTGHRFPGSCGSSGPEGSEAPNTPPRLARGAQHLSHSLHLDPRAPHPGPSAPHPVLCARYPSPRASALGSPRPAPGAPRSPGRAPRSPGHSPRGAPLRPSWPLLLSPHERTLWLVSNSREWRSPLAACSSSAPGLRSVLGRCSSLESVPQQKYIPLLRPVACSGFRPSRCHRLPNAG